MRHVLKETTYEALKTLCWNHPECRGLLAKCPTAYPFKDPGNAGAVSGGGSDDDRSGVPDVWH
jgi:hypothetical protein